MGSYKAFTGRPILQKRVGRFTFRVSRLKAVTPLVLDDGTEVIRGVLRSLTPFERRLKHMFPSLYPGMPPMDARNLRTLELPLPGGAIDIAIYYHKANRPAP
jgi:hypothetical protein